MRLRHDRRKKWLTHHCSRVNRSHSLARLITVTERARHTDASYTVDTGHVCLTHMCTCTYKCKCVNINMYAVNVNVSMNTPAAYRTEAVCEPLLSTYIIQAPEASGKTQPKYATAPAAGPANADERPETSTDRYPNGGVPGTRIGGRREEGSTLHHPTGCHPVGVSSDTYPHRLASVTCRPNHTATNASLVGIGGGH